MTAIGHKCSIPTFDLLFLTAHPALISKIYLQSVPPFSHLQIFLLVYTKALLFHSWPLSRQWQQWTRKLFYYQCLALYQMFQLEWKTNACCYFQFLLVCSLFYCTLFIFLLLFIFRLRHERSPNIGWVCKPQNEPNDWIIIHAS